MESEAEAVRILVMEDDIALAETVRRVLVDRFDVDVAHDLDETLAVVADREYALVISDLFIAESVEGRRDRGGVTLISALRNGLMGAPPWGRTVPIVAMTGAAAYNGFDPLDVAANIGASALLRKPFSSGELLEVVIAQLRRGHSSPR